MYRDALKILIVEDSPEDREAYRRALREIPDGPHSVLEAESADEGLSLYRRELPDCVLLDYRLPDSDGLAVLATLRGEYPDRLLPVVMLTGQGSESVAVQAMQFGAADYLVKDVRGHFIRLLPAVLAKVLLASRLLAEKRQADEALAESEARFRGLADAAREGIAIVTAGESAQIIDANHQLATVLGCGSPEALVGRAMPDLVVPALRDAFAAWVNQDGAPARAWELLRKDGASFPAECSTLMLPFRDPRARADARVITVWDLTEQKRAEQTRLDNARLQGALEMAGSACHYLNQPLQVITGQAEILLGHVPPGELRDTLGTIFRNALKLGGIVHRIRGMTEYKTEEYIGQVRLVDLAGEAVGCCELGGSSPPPVNAA
jgi:PAS domain S-box-containing protein